MKDGRYMFEWPQRETYITVLKNSGTDSVVIVVRCSVKQIHEKYL
jgi:hypothetical protein